MSMFSLNFVKLFLLFLILGLQTGTAFPQNLVDGVQVPWQEPKATPRDFSRDRRLARLVTLQDECLTLKQLLQQLSTNEVNLTCSIACSEQKFQIRVINRRLDTLLTILAEMLPGKWEKTQYGYVLSYTETALEYRKRWWNVYKQQKTIAMTAIKENLLQQMRQPRQNLTDADKARLNKQGPGIIQGIESYESAMDMWRALPANIQEQAAGGEWDSPVFYRLSDALYLSDTPVEGSEVFWFRDLPATAQKQIMDSHNRLRTEGYLDTNAGLFLLTNHFGHYIQSSIMLKNKSILPLDSTITATNPDAVTCATLNHQPLLTLLEIPYFRNQHKNSRLLKALVTYQQKRVWQNEKPKEVTPQEEQPRRQDVFAWVADKGKIEIIADYYYCLPGSPMSKEQKEADLPHPIQEELNVQAERLDTSWKQDKSGIYMFRHNRWYRNDRLEAPEKIVTSLLKQVKSFEAKYPSASKTEKQNKGQLQEKDVDTLNLCVAISQQLDGYQIANGLSRYTIPGKTTKDGFRVRPFAILAETILNNPRTIAFYGSLNANQRERLQSGQLSYAELALSQRTIAESVLPALKILAKVESQILLLVGIEKESGQFFNSPDIDSREISPSLSFPPTLRLLLPNNPTE